MSSFGLGSPRRLFVVAHEQMVYALEVALNNYKPGVDEHGRIMPFGEVSQAKQGLPEWQP